MRSVVLILPMAGMVLFSGSALADTASALCSLTPKDAAVEAEKRPCSFSQRQGYVTITWDGETEPFADLSPGADAGAYTDTQGKPAYRKKGLGEKGQVYDTEAGTIRVYWAN